MAPQIELPPVTPAAQALEYTRFASWFPHYRRYSPKASSIDLLAVQPDFLQWLEEDGLVLPLDSDDRPLGSTVIRELDERGDNADEDVVDDDDDDESSARDFSSLNERIRQIIGKYEGAVFPKLDWSAPLDAAWIVPGSTLRCTEPSDVYLLLKSSDFVNQDVSQLRELQRMASSEHGDATMPDIRPHLVLKKFFSMPTSHEFRCFVRAGRMVCICQRDIGTYFEHLQPREVQHTMQRKLQHFFDAVLRPAQEHAFNSDDMPSAAVPFTLQDFVWDAYLTRDLSRVMIVDINPYLERTDALLWDWSEVEAEAQRVSESRDAVAKGSESASGADNDTDDTKEVGRLPSLRLVTSRAQTTQSFPTYAHNMMPTDVVGLSQGTDIANFARQFNEQLAQAAMPSVDDVDDAATSADGGLNEGGPVR